MKKSGLIFSILFLVLIGSVFALHTATITLNPTSGYETVNANFELEVKNNNESANSIANVTLSHQGYTTTYIQNPTSPWTSNGDINWYGGTLPVKWLGYFYFNATAQNVDSNTSFDWIVTTRDTNGDSQVNNLSVIILDDKIPPTLSNQNLTTGSFVKSGSYTFSINAIDAETGVKEGKLDYDYTNAYYGTSGLNHNESLIPNNGVYSKLINLIYDPSKKYMELKFSVFDNVNNEANLTQYIRIDGDTPLVTLISPNTTLHTNVNVSFHFNVFDDSFNNTYIGGLPTLNPTLDCTLDIGNGLLQQTITINNITETQIFNPNLLSITQDNTYNWYITCTDKAGWVGTSETRNFILDRTGPTITLNPPPLNGAIITQGTIINLLITDISGVDSVTYNGNPLVYPYINTTGFSEGNNIINIQANDTLGNIASSSFNFIIDNTPPTISGFLPADGALTGENVTIQYTVTDNYASSLICNIYSNTSSIWKIDATQNILNGSIGTFSYNGLTDGNYIWNIKCTDGVGLSTTAPVPTYSFTIDTIPPTITLISPADGSNNLVMPPITFVYSPIDTNSGIASCSLNIDGRVTPGPIPDIGVLTYSLSSSNDPYPWYITCTDKAGNIGSSGNYTLYRDDILPVISNIINSSDSSTATINWDTLNEFSNSTVKYSTNILDLNSKIQGSDYVTQHTITINSLSASTVYYYQIFSTDKWGNVGNSSIYNFTTTATPPAGPDNTGGGGGGGHSSEVTACSDSDFTCSVWTACEGTGTIGSQSRTCALKEGIECTGDYKPFSLRACALPIVEEVKEETGLPSIINSITGMSITDGLKSTPAQALLVALFIILTITAFYRWLRRPKVPDTIYINN